MENTIFKAIEKNDIEKVRRFLEDGADIDTKDSDGWTPLLIACWDGHYDIINLLLKNGADVNQKVSNGWTPLHRACRDGRYDIVKLLLENGADKKIIDNNNKSPLDMAMQIGHTDIINIINSFDCFVHVLQRRKIINKTISFFQFHCNYHMLIKISLFPKKSPFYKLLKSLDRALHFRRVEKKL